MKWWFWVLAGVAVAGLAGLVIYRAVWSVELTLIAAPHDAVVYVNGEAVKNKATRRVRPGDYAVRVEREGFITEERELGLARGEARVVFALLPADGNYEWYINNPEDGQILDAVMSERADELERELVERWPVLAELPRTTNFYELTLFGLPSAEEAKLVLELTIYEIPRDGLWATPEKFAEYAAECREWLAARGLMAEEYEIRAGN